MVAIETAWPSEPDLFPVPPCAERGPQLKKDRVCVPSSSLQASLCDGDLAPLKRRDPRRAGEQGCAFLSETPETRWPRPGPHILATRPWRAGISIRSPVNQGWPCDLFLPRDCSRGDTASLKTESEVGWGWGE